MSDTKSEAPADKLALYQKLVATRPDVELKGARMPYTSLNGHMFSFLTPTGTLALRLPAGAREAFLERYETSLCVQHGRVMKEYVEVPDALLAQTRKLKEYFDQSHAHVASLAPKPTTRTNKKAVPQNKQKKVARKK
jgi:hypothetical protein